MIYHIVGADMWRAAVAAGTYRPTSLDEEGFIHCSAARQVVGVANERYRGSEGLVLLELDEGSLGPAVVWEDCYELGQEFPHVYRELTPSDVVRIISFPPTEDGTFTLPAALTEA